MKCTADHEAYSKLYSVPWLKESVVVDKKYRGKELADVTLINVPQKLAGIALVESPTSLRLVFINWDRQYYLGWADAFTVTIKNFNNELIDLEIPSSSILDDGESIVIPFPGCKEKQLSANRRIPRVIYNISQPLHKKSSHEVRCLLKNVRKLTSRIQNTSLYLIVEDDACEKESFATDFPGFREAYSSLIPGSYKADLMRYWLVYKYGGIYTDDKATIRVSVDSEPFDILLNDNIDMFIGIYKQGYGVPVAPEIAFFGAKAGCTVLKKALEKAIENINSRTYGDHRLSITGNMMLSSIIPLSAKFNAEGGGFQFAQVDFEGDTIKLLGMDRNYEKIFYGKKELVWNRQVIPFKEWSKPKTYYEDLWLKREVYVDNNPPPPPKRLLAPLVGVGILVFILVLIIMFSR